VLSHLFRFCASDRSPRNSLRQALVPLSIEHHLTGDYVGPKTIAALKQRIGTGAHRENGESKERKPQFPPLPPVKSPFPVAALAEQTIIRWCDWLDAAIHQRIHQHWHLAPACFDPDPETRHLANLGHAQRHLACLDERARACWLLDFAAAADHYQDSPKWSALGKGMDAAPARPWPYAEVDTLVVALWPMVTANNWTYRDLINVLRSLDTRPPALNPFHRYPCGEDEGEIEDYLHATFRNLLGEQKARHRLGFDVAASGQGDLAAIYIDEAKGNDLTLRALFTCRTEDWHFLKTVLCFFLRNVSSMQGAGDESGLGRQICWEVAKKHAGRFISVNFGSKKHDLGFALMNQLSVAQKRFPRSEQDIAADYFALRKIHTGTRWTFSEGRNALNAASHCDIAWAGALATHVHLERPHGAAGIVGWDGMNSSNAAAYAKMSPQEQMLWSDDPRIWHRL